MCQALSRPGSRKSAVSPCASCDLARCNIEVNDRILSRAGRATAGVKTVRYSRAFQAGRQHAAAAAILAPHGAQYLPNGAGPGRPPTRRWRISQCASSVARAGPSICMGPPDRARRQDPVVKAVHSSSTETGGLPARTAAIRSPPLQSCRSAPMAAAPAGSAIRQADAYELTQLSSVMGLRDLRAVVPSRGVLGLRYLTCSMNARSLGKT